MMGMDTLIGVVIGGLITYFVEKGLQNRQFKKDEKDKKEILKSQLRTLAQGIEDDFKRLKDLRNTIYGNAYPREYFDIHIKESIITELTKTILFPANKDIFVRVVRMLRRMTLLNKQIEFMQDIISGKTSNIIMHKDSKLRIEIDHAVGIIDDLINTDIRETNNRPELSVKIESIAQIL